MTRQNGHIPTSLTKEIMPAILSRETDEGEPWYTVLSMGKGWQNRTYQNNQTGNIFKGEPVTGGNPESPYGFESAGLKWGITYQFEGFRNNVFGVNVNTGKPEKYGSDNMTMDRLYYILVNTFNNGEDFVERYLNDVAPYTVGAEIKQVVEPALLAYRQYVTRKQQEKADLEAREAEAREKKEEYMKQESKILAGIQRAERDIDKAISSSETASDELRKAKNALSRTNTELRKIRSSISSLSEEIKLAEEAVSNVGSIYAPVLDLLTDTTNLGIFTKAGTIRKRLRYENVFGEDDSEYVGRKLYEVAPEIYSEYSQKMELAETEDRARLDSAISARAEAEEKEENVLARRQRAVERVEGANLSISQSAKAMSLAERRKTKYMSNYESYKKGLEDFITDLGSDKIKIRGKSWEEESERVADILREDFHRCIASGQVPLAKGMVSEGAIKRRRELGLDDDPSHVFYASGQFARSIVFNVRIRNG